jgi:hypothetical protein
MRGLGLLVVNLSNGDLGGTARSIGTLCWQFVAACDRLFLGANVTLEKGFT